MQKVIRRPSWICSRCLRSQRRFNHTSSAIGIKSEQTFERAYLSGQNDLSKDSSLRDVFDSKGFWNDFSRSSKTTSGLIGNIHLTTPQGFQKFAEKSLIQCKKLVEKTLTAETIEEYKAIPKDLDRLSDLLCRVIDLSDFIRSIHPDARIGSAATASYSIMLQYMNELNTTTGLNSKLKHAWSTPEIYSQWSEEEKMAAKILMKDFAQSGIDLPIKQREEFVSLSNEIAQVGTDFTNGMEPAKDHISLSSKQLMGVDPTLIAGMSSWSRANIPVYSSISRIIMGSSHDANTRKLLYTAERTASKRTINSLERLLLLRAKLAQVTGHSNFAQMTLSDKMSKTPQSVNNFLQSLNDSNRGHVHKELARLLEIKKDFEPGAIEVFPWDHRYLTQKLSQIKSKSSIRTSKSRLHENIKSYFSLGHVMQGLSNLFQSLYGVRLIPKQTQIGEVWDSEVRRLDVHTESNEHIATMYCDLFSRPGKLPNPAHFTLVCSREISENEIHECYIRNEPLNDGMPTLQIDQKSHHQIPIIALVCAFPDSGELSKEPSLLSSHSVTTLFHEMGHAIHSILGRTSMQGISGTRCATDFAELPSVLMEYFATDPTVLKMFARHWKTQKSIPDEMIDALKQEQHDKAEKTGGWDNENQILMAMLDQIYHSSEPVNALQNGYYDTTNVYHKIWDDYSSVKEPHETAWQGFFGHLYGYGATYYSYLFDRAIARQVWKIVFNDGKNSGAIDRKSGQRFKDEVLRWGGGRDPWICLEELMGDGKGILAEGGELAMLEVGKWGVGAGNEGAM